jgi:hypothetical protein
VDYDARLIARTVSATMINTVVTRKAAYQREPCAAVQNSTTQASCTTAGAARVAAQRSWGYVPSGGLGLVVVVLIVLLLSGRL